MQNLYCCPDKDTPACRKGKCPHQKTKGRAPCFPFTDTETSNLRAQGRYVGPPAYLTKKPKPHIMFPNRLSRRPTCTDDMTVQELIEEMNRHPNTNPKITPL